MELRRVHSRCVVELAFSEHYSQEKGMVRALDSSMERKEAIVREGVRRPQEGMENEEGRARSVTR